jgi:hypothetical protein
MRTDTWFFATTHAPRPAVPERRPALSDAWRRAWRRAGQRLVAWGENARHHRMGSWQATLRGSDGYKGSSVK